MKNISISIAKISLSLAALCLSLLAISIPTDNGPLLSIPDEMRLFFSVAGFILLIGTAYILDWAIDSFSSNDWDELDKIASDLGEPPFDRSKNFFLARLRLFGGGYFLLSLSIGTLAFLMLWLFTYQASIGSQSDKLLSSLLAGFAGLALIIKMMTRRLGSVKWSIIIVGFLAIGSIIFSFIKN